MKKISSSEEFRKLIAQIARKEAGFLRSIDNLEDPYDFYQLYEKIIRLSSSYFEVEVNDTHIPFYMKFDLVTIVLDLIYGDEGTNKLVKKICTMPDDSKLLTEIQSEARVTVDVAILACIVDSFETPYTLLKHLHDNIEIIPLKNYEYVIKRISFLLETLSAIIQQKLYNEDSNILNKEVTDFTFASMQNDEKKIKKTEVYKLLSVEYPEVLKVYEQSIKTLTRMQTRKTILT